MSDNKPNSKKSIVITDTSTGIGEDAAKFFAQKDWTVFAGVRTQSDVDRLSSYNQNIKPLILDVTNQEQVDKAFEDIRVAVGADGLDALINNSGREYFAPVEFFPMNEAQEQFEFNVFGAIRVTQAALPLLRIGSPGRIVNVSSVAPKLCGVLGGMYCGSKKALDCISESMRRELNQWGIKVSVLKPGPVKSPSHDAAIQRASEIQQTISETSKGDEFYGKLMNGLPLAIEKFKKIGMANPSYSTSVIYEAITTKNPKSFYWDTWGTWFSTLFAGLLPTWIADKALHSFFNAN